MDPGMLRDHLRLAEQHVAQGEMHITKQYDVIDELERHGHDTELARTILQTLLDTQTSHEADRDRLQAELDKLSSK
jgi:hypothetical protein